MVKRLLVYFMPIFLFWSTQAFAYKMNFDDVLQRIDGKLTASQSLMKNKNDVQIDKYLNFGKRERLNLKRLLNLRPRIVRNIIFKRDDLKWIEKIRLFKKYLHHYRKNGDSGPSPVPEPATNVLLGAGLIGAAARARKAKR